MEKQAAFAQEPSWQGKHKSYAGMEGPRRASMQNRKAWKDGKHLLRSPHVKWKDMELKKQLPTCAHAVNRWSQQSTEWMGGSCHSSDVYSGMDERVKPFMAWGGQQTFACLGQQRHPTVKHEVWVLVVQNAACCVSRHSRKQKQTTISKAKLAGP
eukprot:1140747-Pelagomonas_calceolata.AAC.5